MVSKTEREMSTRDTDDALDDMFDTEDFDTALDDALDRADMELEIADLELHEDELDDGELEDAESDDPDAELADDDHTDDDVTGTDTVADDDVEDADAELDDITDEHVVIPRDVTGEYVLPDTVPVTPHDVDDNTVELDLDDDRDLDDRDLDDDDDVVARRGDADDDDLDGDVDVSDDILEELRRADIDGPVVPIAPQDESAALRRRPRRAADYDPAPVPIPARVPRVLGRKPRVRKVTRVVRHVDPWSVFKIALVAHLVLYIIVLTASVLLWNVANATGTVQNVERFFESFGWNSFEFNGGEMYHAGWVAGLFVVIGLTGLAVLAATLFNLITDLVGGVRLTVLEEEVIETRTSPMRRFVVRRSEPEVPSVITGSGGAMIREAVVDDTGAIDRPTR